jgi:hypothetical protein
MLDERELTGLFALILTFPEGATEIDRPIIINIQMNISL